MPTSSTFSWRNYEKKTEIVISEIRKLAESLDDNDSTQRSIKIILFTLLGSLCNDSPPNHLYELHTICYNFSCKKVEELKNIMEKRTKLLN
jgi:hypothetical protein